MSYRNPEIIQDRSGEVYGQAIANIGQSLAQGIATGAANRERLRKEADAETKRVQGIGYQIESKAYSNRSKNYLALKKTEPGVAEQFNERTESLLRGTEGQMGAIEANTLLATEANLSIDRKKELRAIVNKYETFSTGMVGNAGKIIAETDLYNKTSPADFNSKYRWAGADEKERYSSQFAAAAFSNQEIPGGRTEKILQDPGENGENVVTVKTYLDPNDIANKGLFDDEEMYPRNENGEVVLEWSKDLNKWDEGLLEEIEAVPDSIEIFKTAGITDEKGGFSDDQFLNISGSSDKIEGIGQYSQVKTSKDVNVSGWASNKVLQDDIKSKAAGLQGMRDEELSSFLSVKMKYPIDMKEFRSKTTQDQEAIIAYELNQEFIIQKTSGLNSRDAKEGEPGAVLDPESPYKVDQNGDQIKDSEGNLIGNYKIYSEGTENIKGTPQAPTLPENPNDAAQSLINDFFENPAQSYSTFKGSAGEQATYDSNNREMRISGLVDSSGKPAQDEIFNFDSKNDIAKFANILLESSGFVGNDAQGRKIKQAYTKEMTKNIDKFLKKWDWYDTSKGKSEDNIEKNDFDVSDNSN
jgi:hypothetical protein|tara:strand:+ start:5869 stop:7617 length:1749 start_codon:yes stop_codon:yes gene_type:complete